jgi:hypothetical protein
MNHPPRKFFVSPRAGSTSQCGFASATLHVRNTVIAILFLISSVLPAHAAAGQRPSNQNPRSAIGKLKIWVPAGIIGDDYWIYLDGHLTSAPPHGTTNPRSNAFITVQIGNVGSGGKLTTKIGWDLWTRDGLALAIRHEEYDNHLLSYINSASGDSMHVFQPLLLSLAPGKHTVDVAMLSESFTDPIFVAMRSFPFAITRTYVADVRPGQTTQIYIGVPDNWSNSPAPISALLIGGFCNGLSTPNVNELFSNLKSSVKSYFDDPMGKILRDASAAFTSRSRGVAVLDLPETLSGSREFDGRQIEEIADSISAHHSIPTHRDVMECRKKFPQYPEIYAEYDRMISFVESDKESLRKFGSSLGRGR